MPVSEKQSGDSIKTGLLFEWVCRELGLSADRTAAAERKADHELAHSWLRAVHGVELHPFSPPIVSAFFEESGEEME